MDDSENDYYEEENYIDDFEDAPEKDIDEASGNFDEDDIHYNCDSESASEDIIDEVNEYYEEDDIDYDYEEQTDDYNEDYDENDNNDDSNNNNEYDTDEYEEGIYSKPINQSNVSGGTSSSSSHNELFLLTSDCKAMLETVKSCILTFIQSIQSQYYDMKTMFTDVSKTLIVTAKKTIPKEKFDELETIVDCLAQSNISPDFLREILSQIDNVTTNSVSNNNSTNISSSLHSIHGKISQIYKKLESNKQFCIEINQSINLAVNDPKIQTDELSEQKDFIKKIQEENDLYLKEIKNLLQLMGKEENLSPGSFSVFQQSCEATSKYDVINSRSLIYHPETDQIGEGGFCYVFHGKYNGKDVAIKKLKIDLQYVSDQYIDCMRREARCLKNLLHPNIVQFIGIVWEPNFHGVVLEYNAKKDLMHFLKNQSLPLKLKLKLLCDIAKGVHYLHWLPKTIVHNDLKATNILITDDITAKITDFGNAEWKSWTTELFYTQLRENRVISGTLTHLSPERWTNIHECNIKSDIYSYGVLIWETFSEKTPFASSNNESIKLAVTEGQRPNEKLLPEEMPTEIINLMKKCWHQNLTERPAMKQIVDMLEEQLSRDQNTTEANDDLVVGNDLPTKPNTHQFHRCTCVCSEPFMDFEINKLLAIAYGRIYQEQEENFTHKAIIEFSLNVQMKNNTQNLPEINEMSDMEKQEVARQLLFREPINMHLPHKILRCNSEESIKFELSLNTKEWQMITSLDAIAEQEIMIGSVLPCVKKSFDGGSYRKIYVLKGTTASLTAAFDVSHLPKTSGAPNLIPFVLQHSNEIKTTVFKDVSGKDTGLSESNILKLTRKINPSYIIDIGLAMNYTAAEIEQIELKETNRNDKIRAMFDLISGWCKQNITDGLSVFEITNILVNILRECSCEEAVLMLQKMNPK